MRSFSTIAITIPTMLWIVSVQADTSYTPPPASGGPYPASGVPANASGNAPLPSETGASSATAQFRLGGQPFFFSARQYVKPTDKSSRRGYPTSKNTISEFEFTTESFATTPRPEPESENINEFSSGQPVPDGGTYYVLLPDGRLQKVTYITMPLEESVGRLQSRGEQSSEQNANGYLANVKYQDVEPIRGPIYAYSAAPLIRIY